MKINENNQDFKYMGFEPDPEAFDCLQLNLKDFGVEVYNMALSNKIGSVKFYLDTQGANSSIDYFGEEKSISIEPHDDDLIVDFEIVYNNPEICLHADLSQQYPFLSPNFQRS